MPWDPIRELQVWQDRLGRHHLEAWAPPIDVYETAEMYVITAEVPGLSREQVELALEETRLTIRGSRPDHPAASASTVRFHQVERGRGPFARTFEFAERVDSTRVTADLSHGVLTITLPKFPEAPARKIQVG
jgi:HSP20 family protein